MWMTIVVMSCVNAVFLALAFKLTVSAWATIQARRHGVAVPYDQWDALTKREDQLCELLSIGQADTVDPDHIFGLVAKLLEERKQLGGKDNHTKVRLRELLAEAQTERDEAEAKAASRLRDCTKMAGILGVERAKVRQLEKGHESP